MTNRIGNLITTGILLHGMVGCGEGEMFSHSRTPRTGSVERSGRRAFDGAPPVIPHEAFGSECIKCHTSAGAEVPGTGYAPANPHLMTANMSRAMNCRQCHVFRKSSGTFRESTFVGLRQDLRRGERAFPGAPPVMPHSVFMRENCNACHSGPSARPEIRSSHPERRHCRQCHLSRAPTARGHDV